MKSDEDRTLFIYWGRRGAISEIVLELAGIAGDRAVFSVSRQNELFVEISRAAQRVLPIDTFTRSFGSIFGLHRLWAIRRSLLAAIKEQRITRVVVLMSHVWTPLIADSIRGAGARYVVIVHDATSHPGDATAIINRWLIRDALKADEVVTHSAYVRSALIARFPQLEDRTTSFFLPVFGSRAVRGRAATGGPAGFLFFGRIMAYKGLPLFVEACELLRGRGHAFRIGVAGEGDLGELKGRLMALDAEIINRWLDYDEIATILGRYDCMVVSNVEASQSGVVALAHGFGMPVVVTPVGGLTEQIEDHRSGLVAHQISAPALADAMELFITDAALRTQLSEGVAAAQEQLGMSRFFEMITGRRSR